jgi:erythritol kinase
MTACAEDWVRPHLNAPQVPDSALAAHYGRMFPAYLDARLAARPVWKQLAAARAGAGHA